jgi:hypothetical protein
MFLTCLACSLFGGVAPGLDLSLLRELATKATSRGVSKEPPKVVQLNRLLTLDPNFATSWMRNHIEVFAKMQFKCQFWMHRL